MRERFIIGALFFVHELWPYFSDDELILPSEKRLAHLPWDNRFKRLTVGCAPIDLPKPGRSAPSLYPPLGRKTKNG